MAKSKLILLREKMQLSRYRVAQDLDISNNRLARVENMYGDSIPRDILVALSKYYGQALTLEDFLS